jgi:hypothetical protein
MLNDKILRVVEFVAMEEVVPIILEHGLSIV